MWGLAFCLDTEPLVHCCKHQDTWLASLCFSCLSLYLLVDAMGVTYTCAVLRYAASRDLDSVHQVCTVSAVPSAAPFSQRRTKVQS